VINSQYNSITIALKMPLFAKAAVLGDLYSIQVNYIIFFSHPGFVIGQI